MRVIDVRNVNHALPEGLRMLDLEGVQRDSRNGPVKVVPGPVTTVYRKPTERVMFYPDRDCNPFFHLFESLWMLAGRNDVAYVKQFVKRMETFSDDGVTFNGAYGFRWREFFGQDQLEKVAQALRDNPEDRRQVVQIWDASDLGKVSKDLPCNTQVYFGRGHEGELNMTVCNRSNDVIWGAYGANAVHFSYLLEYMAAWIGCPVGAYWQISNNFHGYLNTYEPLKHLADLAADPYRQPPLNEPYAVGMVTPFPLVNTGIATWEKDLMMFLEEGENAIGYSDPFFRRVAVPMLRAYRAYKDNVGEQRYALALGELSQVKATDWQLAGQEWIERRFKKFVKAQDDGPEHQAD